MWLFWNSDDLISDNFFWTNDLTVHALIEVRVCIES